MILKFKSGDEWVIFGEIDHLTYRIDKPCDSKAGIVRSEKAKLLVYEPSEESPAISPARIVSFFTKNMAEATEIIAFSPIYLMNDQGRTVETI